MNLEDDAFSWIKKCPPECRESGEDLCGSIEWTVGFSSTPSLSIKKWSLWGL